MSRNRIPTPIIDFVKDYAASGASRFHMPGHKGRGFVRDDAAIDALFSRDITEIPGADSLYEASGIIRESEQHASSLFGTGATLYATEGSSQCIRAMLALVTRFTPSHFSNASRPLILAARNVHRSFITACALLDLDVAWLYPESDSFSLCACPVTAKQVKEAIVKMPVKPAAVYVTSPDYLGNILDISSIAAAVHSFGIPLLVDNAHGAYLHFLPTPMHPMDLEADMCCDSAHKTLPALTGCAYLHIQKGSPCNWFQNAKKAMALFGSTSPSYLLLQSLDAINPLLAESFPDALLTCIARVAECKKVLCQHGWHFVEDHAKEEPFFEASTEAGGASPSVLSHEPLKITLDASSCGYQGSELADLLRKHQIECEYADPDYLVLMVSPSNQEQDFQKLEQVLLSIPVHGDFEDSLLSQDSCNGSDALEDALPVAPQWKSPDLNGDSPVLSIREAFFSETEELAVKHAIGRICADTAISCPPAIPIVVCGEKILPEHLPLFHHYRISTISVIKEPFENSN